MNRYEKIFAITYILFIILVLSVSLISLMNSTLGWESESLKIALVSAAGSIIGGFITLIGVKWTLDKQEKQEFKRTYKTANYLFTELLPLFIKINNKYKSISIKNFNGTLNDFKTACEDFIKKAQELSKVASEVDIDLFKLIKEAEYSSSRIIEQIDNMGVGNTDQEIIKTLSVHLQGILRADVGIEKIVRELKAKI